MTEPETIEYKGELVGKVCGCNLYVHTTADGKKHFESKCLSKEARNELNAVFEQEAILSVDPKVVLAELLDTPPAAPAAPAASEPAPEPVTES